jgi:hypothetical protein
MALSNDKYQGLPKDPLDRALTYREEGYDRKDVDVFGFLQRNRGNLGISSSHIHEVAWSCKDSVKLNRYKQVECVRVPAAKLQDWKKCNKAKCESDALMPKYSDLMRFALLTKTHFTHANKLYKDGNRSVFNNGKVPIVFAPGALAGEAGKILEEGVLCSVYREELWDDTEALDALMQTDNDDSDIQMGEDAMQMMGRVDTALSAVQDAPKTPELENVLEEMKRVGLRSWSEEHTINFIEFRLKLTQGHAECLRQCVFHSVSGRVVVTPAD